MSNNNCFLYLLPIELFYEICKYLLIEEIGYFALSSFELSKTLKPDVILPKNKLKFMTFLKENKLTIADGIIFSIKINHDTFYKILRAEISSKTLLHVAKKHCQNITLTKSLRWKSLKNRIIAFKKWLNAGLLTYLLYLLDIHHYIINKKKCPLLNPFIDNIPAYEMINYFDKNYWMQTYLMVNCNMWVQSFRDTPYLKSNNNNNIPYFLKISYNYDYSMYKDKEMIILIMLYRHYINSNDDEIIPRLFGKAMSSKLVNNRRQCFIKNTNDFNLAIKCDSYKSITNNHYYELIEYYLKKNPKIFDKYAQFCKEYGIYNNICKIGKKIMKNENFTINSLPEIIPQCPICTGIYSIKYIN